MGLDWKPLNKPKPSQEKEFEDIFLTLTGKKKVNSSVFSKLFGNKQKSQEALLKSFLDISIPDYITLKAPVVGIDQEATEWAKTKYPDRTNQNQSLEMFLQEMHGYYVVDLVPEHDGIPVYIAPHAEPHIFRAKFLNDCEEIIGKKMLEEAYTSQLAEGAVNFGNRLMETATNFADQLNLNYLRDQRLPPDSDEHAPDSKAHILFSAAKWLLWWGQRGHGYEADF